MPTSVAGASPAAMAQIATSRPEINGQYTITVDIYSNTADLSGASTLDSWGDYSVEKF